MAVSGGFFVACVFLGILLGGLGFCRSWVVNFCVCLWSLFLGFLWDCVCRVRRSLGVLPVRVLRGLVCVWSSWGCFRVVFVLFVFVCGLLECLWLWLRLRLCLRCFPWRWASVIVPYEKSLRFLLALPCCSLYRDTCTHVVRQPSNDHR